MPNQNTFRADHGSPGVDRRESALVEAFGAAVTLMASRTIVDKDYFDATAQLRSLLASRHVNNFDTQESGEWNKVYVPLRYVFLSDEGAVSVHNTLASMYRTSRGDRRFSLTGLRSQVRAGEFIAFCVGMNQHMIAVNVTRNLNRDNVDRRFKGLLAAVFDLRTDEDLSTLRHPALTAEEGNEVVSRAQAIKPPGDSTRFSVISPHAVADATTVFDLLFVGTDSSATTDMASKVQELRAIGLFVEDAENPDDSPLGYDSAVYWALAQQLRGSTDAPTRGTRRMERSLLRGGLGLNAPQGSSLMRDCAICGHLRPISLMRAAHIKKRSECSRSERLDIPYIGMPACLLNCDSLFEEGYISADSDGTILISPELLIDLEDLSAYADRISGRLVSVWCEERRPYFKWHRNHTFRG
jgi:hypothetical protein